MDKGHLQNKSFKKIIIDIAMIQNKSHDGKEDAEETPSKGIRGNVSVT